MAENFVEASRDATVCGEESTHSISRTARADSLTDSLVDPLVAMGQPTDALTPSSTIRGALNPANQDRPKDAVETIDSAPVVGVDAEWGTLTPEQVDAEADGGPLGGGDTTYTGLMGQEGMDGSVGEDGATGSFDEVGKGTRLTDTEVEAHNAPGSSLSGGAGSMENSKTIEGGSAHVDNDGAQGEIESARKGQSAEDVHGELDSDVGGAGGSAGSLDKGHSVGNSSAEISPDRMSGEANDLRTTSGSAEDVNASTDTPLGQGNAGADSTSYKEVTAGNAGGEVGHGRANGSASDVTGDYANVEGGSAETEAPLGEASVGADSAGFGHGHADSVSGSADKDGMGMSTAGTQSKGAHADNANGSMETLGTGASGGADSVAINSQSTGSTDGKVGTDGNASAGVKDTERKTGDIDGASGKLGKGDKSVQAGGSAEQGSSMESGEADVDATDGSGSVEVVGASHGGAVEDVTIGAGGQEVSLPDAKASVEADADAEMDATDGTAGASLNLSETGGGIGPVGAQLGDIATIGADIDVGDGALHAEIGGQDLTLDLPVEDVTGAIGATTDDVAGALGMDPAQVQGPLGTVLTTAMGVGGEVGGAAAATATTLTGPIRAMGGVVTQQALQGATQLGGAATELGGAMAGNAAKDAAQLGATAQEIGKNMGKRGEEAAAGASAVARGDLTGLGTLATAQAGLVVDAGKAALDVAGQAGEAAIDNAKLIGTSLGNAGKDAAVAAAGNAQKLANYGASSAAMAAQQIGSGAQEGIDTAGKWASKGAMIGAQGAHTAGKSVKQGAKKVAKSMKKYLKKLKDLFTSKKKKRRKKRKARKNRRKDFRKKVAASNQEFRYIEHYAQSIAQLGADELANTQRETTVTGHSMQAFSDAVCGELVVKNDANIVRMVEEQGARKQVANAAAIQATAPLEAAVANHKRQLSGYLSAAHKTIQSETTRVSAHMTEDAEFRSKQLAAFANRDGITMSNGASKAAVKMAEQSSTGRGSLNDVVHNFVSTPGALRDAMDSEASRVSDTLDVSSSLFGRGLAREATRDSARLDRSSQATAAELAARRNNTIDRAHVVESTRNEATDAHVQGLHSALTRKESTTKDVSRRIVHAEGVKSDGAVQRALSTGTTNLDLTKGDMTQTIDTKVEATQSKLTAVDTTHQAQAKAVKTSSNHLYGNKRAKWKAYAKKKIG